MKKRSLYALLFLPFILCSRQIDYYKNDFRERNDTFHLKASFYPKSNQLKLDTFEEKWNVIPRFKRNNIAFGTLYGDIHYNFGSVKAGVFYENGMFVSFNKGFGKTWYATDKDFNTLLHFQNINTQLEPTPISGEGIYYKIGGVFLQKSFKLAQYHFFALKLKLFGSDEVQDITLGGLNTKERFIGAFDYYYKRHNYISKRQATAKAIDGYGYSIDVEYIYNNDFLYLYGGIMNLGGRIYYDSVTRMHYEFDSQTVYKGEDGYNHRKPFGSGYYKDDEFYVDMPTYYKGVIDIAPNRFFSFGDNIEGYKKTVFNELYISLQPFSRVRLKSGYIFEAKTAVFGIYFRNISMEISNNFSFSQQIMQANIHVWF